MFGAIISRHAPDLVGYDFVMIDSEHGLMDLNRGLLGPKPASVSARELRELGLIASPGCLR